MKWAILSDIHGNLEALRAVGEDLRFQGAERIVCLGDVVGYGADPNEAVALLRGLTDSVVAGNHDHGAVGLTEIDHFNSAAREAILWTRDHLSPENAAYLRSLPLILQEGNVTLVHASPLEPEEWHYVLTYPDAEEGFRALPGDLAFIGHSHRPVIVAKGADGRIGSVLSDETRLEKGVRYIINVGSVGQPRDGDPRSAYGFYDDSEKIYSLKRVPYDIGAARKKITKAGLPRVLAQRLAKGM